MLKQAPNISYSHERCEEAQLSIHFVVNKADFASALENGEIVEAVYEPAYSRAHNIAKAVHAHCVANFNFENLPFIRRLFEEDEPQNYYVPYELTEFEGADESNDGGSDVAPVFSITLANPEGGAFEVEQMKAFRNYVQGIIVQVVQAQGCTIEYSGASEYRRYKISATEQLNLGD